MCGTYLKNSTAAGDHGDLKLLMPVIVHQTAAMGYYAAMAAKKKRDWKSVIGIEIDFMQVGCGHRPFLQFCLEFDIFRLYQYIRFLLCLVE